MCKRTLLMLATSTVVCLAPVSGTPLWPPVRVDTTGNVGLYSSLELDASGCPHISYYHETDGNLKYAYYDGLAWVIQTVDSLGDVGKYTGLELDSNEDPHIAYYAGFPDRDLKYAYWTGAAWNIDTVDVGTVRDTYIGLVLDANDYGHISYCVSDNLWYAYKDAGGWHTQVVDAGAFTGYDSSIDLDPTNSDRPCISYIDAGNNWLRYAWYDGAIWQFDTADPTAAPSYSSLAIDPTGVAHIGYSRVDPSPPFPRSLKYAWGTVPGGWSTEVVPYPSTEYGGGPLVLDTANNPWILFYDGENMDLLLAVKNGAWEIDTVCLEPAAYGDLALESGSIPCVSYYDALSGDLICTCGGVGVEEGQEPRSRRQEARLMQSHPNPFTHNTTITLPVASYRLSSRGGFASGEPVAGSRQLGTGNMQHVSLAILDLSGRLIRTLIDEPSNHLTIQPSHQVLWDGRDDHGKRAPSGIYFCRLTVADFGATGKMVLVR